MNFNNNQHRLLAAAAPRQEPGTAAEGSSAHSDAAPQSKPKSKRQTVKSACNACQRRKVKCSGERPICGLCAIRGQECTYDAEAGLTRIEALRRRNKELVEQNANYDAVFRVLRESDFNTAVQQLHQLRASSDAESYAESLRDFGSSGKRRRSLQAQDSHESSQDRAMESSRVLDDHVGSQDGIGPSFGDSTKQLVPLPSHGHLDGGHNLALAQTTTPSDYGHSLPQNYAEIYPYTPPGVPTIATPGGRSSAQPQVLMHQQGMAPAWGMEPQIEPGMSLDREQDDDDAPIDTTIPLWQPYPPEASYWNPPRS